MGYYLIKVEFQTKLFVSHKEFAVQGLGESEAALKACRDCGWKATRTFVPLNPVDAKEIVVRVQAEIGAQNRIAEGRG